MISLAKKSILFVEITFLNLNVLFTQFMPMSEQILSNSMQTQLTVRLSFHVLKTLSLIFIAVLQVAKL